MLNIGIAGSYGKTTAIHILYEYFKKLNKKIYMTTTNGVIDDNNNQVDLYGVCENFDKLRVEMNKKLKRGYDICLIELNEEKGDIDYEQPIASFDIIGVTKWDNRLWNHFQTPEKYIEATNKMLSMGKKIILNYNNTSELVHPEKVYYSFESNSYSKYIYTLTSTSVFDNNIEISGNLDGLYNQENIVVAISVLKELKLYDVDLFKEILSNIIIYNRAEKYQVQDKTVYLDSGYGGIEGVKKFCKDLYDLKDVVIILSPFIQRRNDWVIRDRDLTGKDIRENNINLIGTYHRLLIWDPFPAERILKEDFKLEGYKNFIYINNHEEAVRYALNNKYKVCFVLTREQREEYYEILNKIMIENK